MRESFMTDDTRDHDGFWYRGKATRRRVLGYGDTSNPSIARPRLPIAWARRKSRTRSGFCKRPACWHAVAFVYDWGRFE